MAKTARVYRCMRCRPSLVGVLVGNYLYGYHNLDRTSLSSIPPHPTIHPASVPFRKTPSDAEDVTKSRETRAIVQKASRISNSYPVVPSQRLSEQIRDTEITSTAVNDTASAIARRLALLLLLASLNW